MSTVKKVERISVDDYLRLEERGEERHEYVNGVVYAMVGGTARHNMITGTISSALREHLKGTPCTVFMSDMKVQVGEVFYYPDVMVVCEHIDLDSLFQTQPVLLVEVLSGSTESKDRLEKLVAYQSIPSVTEYVLVSQDKVSIDIYRRYEDAWRLESLSYGDTVTLESVHYQTDAETFYEDVLSSFSRV
jgi:Uma2 family endonuclease